ncbi:hypothetical protein [Actinopolymorpha alba]|uniref:hypothetical protein n=1 Tax=Actinopolymorpha alba TaxID=533267 RepID=UPI00036C0693|nr:hypothetical protein [Actinopolymorpha alba]
MRQLRLLVALLLILATVTQGLSGLLLGLTVLAVNELAGLLIHLEGPGRSRVRRWSGWLRPPAWLRRLGRRWGQRLRSAGPLRSVRRPRLPRWLSRWRRTRRHPAGLFPSYDQVVSDLAWARFSRRDFDVGLRRRLVAAATVRLAEGHGIDLARDPEAARRALGEEAWTVLAPDQPRSNDRGAPGLDVPDIERLVTAIERLSPPAPAPGPEGRP